MLVSGCLQGANVMTLNRPFEDVSRDKEPIIHLGTDRLTEH